ncbi:MAG: iron-containing redox enzyme family protein [Patescibacteria group bacterium]
MPTLTLPSTIESEVEKHSLLRHPFYLAWSAGKLTREQLAGYAKEYYFLAKNVPAVMEAIKENLPKNASDATRVTFAKHAEEEREHIELWERFATSLGVSEKELEAYEPTGTVKEAVASIVEAASEGFEEGIAAMYAFECDLPAISESKIDGLIKFYGLRSEDAHAYFEEHLREEQHLCFWRDLLRKVPSGKISAAVNAARATVSAQNRVLDGVCEKYCPGMAR